MSSSQGLGRTASEPQEHLSVQEIQRQIDETKQKYKDNDQNNESVDSADLLDEIEEFDNFIKRASSQAKKDTYQRSQDLLKQRITLNQQKKEAIQFGERKNQEVAKLTSELKSLEIELSAKLNLQNLSDKSLSHLLDNYQGADQLPHDVKENVQKTIQEVQSLKNELYQMMNEEGVEKILEEELKLEINKLIQQLNDIDKVSRLPDYQDKEQEISTQKKIQKLYSKIKSLVTQEPEPEPIPSPIPNPNPSPIPPPVPGVGIPNPIPVIMTKPPEETEFLEIFDEMKYYSPIPEGCFEKILTQACYAHYFLKNKSTISDENFLKLQEKLDPFLQDQNNLEGIIINAATKLMERYENEGIKNPKILSELKDIKKITVLEKLLVTKNIFQKILLEFRKFHMEKFFDFCEEVKRVAEIIAGKDIYFMMGTTGCGKSTTIQYLCGSEMFKTQINGLDHIGFRNVTNPVLQEVSCSPFARSETRFIKLINNEVRNNAGRLLKIQLVDSPGLFDTQNMEIEVSNQLGIQKAICGAGSVRPIIILSLKKFGDKGEELKKILRFYSTMIKDLDEYLDNFHFFITHSDDKTTIEDVGKRLEDFLQTENDKTKNKEEGVIKFLEIMIDKVGNKQMRLIKPLQKDEIFDILDKVSKDKKPIKYPSNVFQVAIQNEARICISEQFKIHEREILNSFRSSQYFDSNYVIYKLNQLKKFQEIFSEEQDYILKYENCLNKLAQILNEYYTSATKKISDGLSVFNNLVPEDINYFSENLKFAEKREAIRKQFLTELKRGDQPIIVYSSQQYIDELSNQIQKKQLKLGNGENQYQLDSKELYNYFGKIELLIQLEQPVIKKTRDSCFKDFTDELNKKGNYLSRKIDRLYTNDDQEDAVNFYKEIADFFNQILKGVQICSIQLIKGKLEELHSQINSKIQTKFDNIENDEQSQIQSVLRLTQNTVEDMQNLRNLNLSELQAKSTFTISAQLIKDCKKYSEFLNKFSTTLKIFPSLDLYLQTQERKKNLTKSLSYWVFIQEIILQKYIDDPKLKQERIKDIYTQIRTLFDANIVGTEVTSRITTIQQNLDSLIHQKQQEIEAMLPQLSKGISIKKSEGSVSEYTMINLKEAVRTINNLKWIMVAQDEQIMRNHKEQLEGNLQTLVQTIQEEVKYYRLDIENTEHFKYVRQAFKYIDQISQIALILDIKLENSSLDRFKPQILHSIKMIETFIGNKRAPNDDKYCLLQSQEFKKTDSYQKYLSEIKQNEFIIRFIDTQEQHVAKIINSLCDDMESLIIAQPQIIEKEFKEFKNLIETYQEIMSKIQQKSKDFDQQLSYDIKDKHLINPTNCILNYFRIFKNLKTSHQDLWQRIGQFNNIYEDILQEIITMANKINKKIMEQSNNLKETYHQIEVLEQMRILDIHLDRKYFEDYYNSCLDKIKGFQSSIQEKINISILQQNYEETLEILYKQQQINQPTSQENVDKIKQIMKKKCNELRNKIEKGCRCYEDLNKDQINELNQHNDELISIVKVEFEQLTFEKLLGETFQKSIQANQLFNDTLTSNQEQNQKLIENLISKNKFLNAFQQIEIQRKLLQVVQKDRSWLLKLKDQLDQDLEKVHEQFEKTKNPKEIMMKKPKELYEQLTKCCDSYPNESKFNIAKENLIKTLQDQMENFKKNIKDNQFENETVFVIKESINLLQYMPKEIQEQFKVEFEAMEKDILEKRANEYQQINKFLDDDNQDLIYIQRKIDEMKFDVQGIQNEIKLFFKKQCKIAQDLLKINILKVIKENVIKLYEFKFQNKIKKVFQDEIPGVNEFSKLCKCISFVLNQSITIIISQFKINSDDLQLLADNDNEFKEFQIQKIDDQLAKMILLEIINLYNKDKKLTSLIEENLIGQFDNLITEAQNCLQTSESSFKKSFDAQPPQIEMYYGVIKHLYKIDHWLKFLKQKEIQDLYSNQSDQKSKTVNESFIKSYDKIYHQKLGDYLSSSIKSAQQFFEQFKLLNQKTQNLNDERIKFYEQANIYYLELKYSIECTESQKIITLNQFEKYEKHLKDEIDIIVLDASQITERDRDLKTYDKVKYLDILLKNLKQIIDCLEIDQEYISKCQLTIDAVKNKLIKKSNDAAEEMSQSLSQQQDGTFQIDLESISQKLILIQTLGNVDFVKNECGDCINCMIEKMEEVKEEMAKNPKTKSQSEFIFDVGKILKKNPEGSKIIQQYPNFEGIRRALEAEKYPKKDVNYVLDHLQFHNGDQIVNVDKNEKDKLLRYYKNFQDLYMGFLNDYLSPVSLVPENLQQLKAKVLDKAKLNNGIIDQGSLDDIPEIIALLFAIFTIQDSLKCFHKIQKTGKLEGGENYLIKPHAGQIIALFRILGLGHPQITKVKINQAQNKADYIKKLFKGKNQLIFDNLAQIKTGEGKSYTLGMLSSIFALWGFDVNCASYSEYLCGRDFDSFAQFFEFLGIKQFIQYSTFNKVCEDYLNQNGDVRKMVLERILINPQEQVQIIEQENKGRFKERNGQQKRPQILLIDEVDVFFGSNFFGKMFAPTTRIRCPEVTQLLDYIWKQRDIKLNQEKFRNFKASNEYKQCLALFKQEYIKLFDASCRDMLFEVQNYKDHGYKVINQRIGYIYQDQISYSMNFGYKTTFAHYHEFENEKITKEELDKCKSISLSCMQFSYTEIPIQFVFTLGVTGTLSALSASEIDIVKKTFQIQNFTYIPSVYGASNLDWEHRGNRIQVEGTKDDYYMTIIREINDNLQSIRSQRTAQDQSLSQEELKQIEQIQADQTAGKNRAVLVFFENETKLQEFRESRYVKDKVAHQTLTEKISSNEEKEKIVSHATYPRSVTFATPGFGRGTDFICRDLEVEMNGGLHVILTFMCTLQSEFVQIQGRTARQGNKGSFSMVLLDEDLKSFNLSLRDKDFSDYEEVKGDYWPVLVKKRDELLMKSQVNELKDIAEIKNLHNKSMEIQTIINDASKNDKICTYLLSINNDRQFESEPVKSLILMDATGSMSNLLQKAKNSVSIMFEKTSEILRDNNISPDLILLQFAVYRNYGSPVDLILQHSTWESNPQNLRKFMDGISASGGQGREAVEVGLQHSVYEANNPGSVPLSQIFLIGDAPPNTPSEVEQKRGNETQWQGTKFENKVQWDHETEKLKNLNIPVHTFYVKNRAQDDFQKIAMMTNGTCQFLDINNEAEGQKQLIQMFSSQLLKQIGDCSGTNGLGERMVMQFIQKFN